MEKSTKLIIAAVGLGGLGYFLYKKGLFSKTTTTEVAKDVKKVDDVVKKVDDVVKQVIDTGKKTAVEPATKPCEVTYHNCTRNPRKEIIQIPYDDENCDTPMRFGGYQPDKPPCAESIEREPKPIYTPSYNNPYLYDNLGFRDNTYFDQPTKIDYGTGKYNQEVATDYMQRDMANVRLNQFLYA